MVVMFKLLKLLILMVIIVGVGAMFLPLGSVEYRDPQMAGVLVVPSLSMLEKETMVDGDYVAEFQTVRSEWALEQEFAKMLSEKYTERVCVDGKVGYVSENNQIVLESYQIESGFPFSKFIINYKTGLDC